MRMKAFAPGLTVSMMLFSLVAPGQSLANALYKKIAPSVLVLYVRSGGQYVSQGTGFVISDGRIVTNAHVVNAGAVFVELGPARIPAHVDATDQLNDLALLSVKGDLGLTPLPLATDAAEPGDSIYVIGNPEGLARSISTGVVAARRTVNGKSILQITAAISHGSSGSPVVNASGAVVGVASSMITEGENLNFAVPVNLLVSLIAGRTEPGNFASLLATAKQLDKSAATLTYSSDADSAYQQQVSRAGAAYMRALASAEGNADEIHQVYGDYPALAVAHAEVAARDGSTSELDLAYALESAQRYPEALVAVNSAIADSAAPQSAPYIEKAELLKETKQFDAADAAFRQAQDMEPPTPDANDEYRIYSGLAEADFALGRYAESDAWFQKLVATGKINEWDWSAQAARLLQEKSFSDAGAAYEKAAELGVQKFSFDPIYDLWENATNAFWIAAQNDDALGAARQCIAAGAGKDAAKSDVEYCHRAIASILNDRDVYPSALAEAKAAVALDPTDAWAFDAIARADDGMQDPGAGIEAEKTALALSDGKYADMQFEMGSLYFGQKDWSLAAASFQEAFQLDASSWSAAYNVALSDARQSDFTDAALWYQKALAANPPDTNREQIVQHINQLRGLGY